MGGRANAYLPTAFETLPDEQLAKVADAFGTPALVIDGTILDAVAERWRTAVAAAPVPTRLFYASKALSVGGLLRRLHAHGFGVEVVSAGEYAVARRAGVPPSAILYQGSPKVPAEAQAVLAGGVRAVVIDSPFEIPLLDRLAAPGTAALIRLNPGGNPHTHAYIATATAESKFGIVAGAELDAVLDELGRARNLRLAGFHVHVGSELREPGDYERAFATFAATVAEAMGRAGVPHPAIDVGGGLGVRYFDEPTLNPSEFLAIAWRHLAPLAPREIWAEPGRSIVSEAGVLLYRVLGLKRRSHFTFAFVDGGMADNIRPALYGAVYPVRKVHGADTAARVPYRLVGRYCESGDVVREEVELPPLAAGDLLAVGSAGAYTWSMSSRYNGVGRPPVVFLPADGDPVLWARRETIEDLLATDIEGGA
jgi:diaminopimelate decarboxylase